MISATVKAGDSSTKYLGMEASKLQSNIEINNYRISGKLKKIDHFEEFNPSDPSEQSGHYLVLDLKPIDGATIKTKIGKSGKEAEVTDGFCVYLVKNEKTQQIYVTTEKGEDTKTKVYDLDGLELE